MLTCLLLTACRSRKIELTRPDTSEKALQKEKELDQKHDLKLQKSREREEKARDKLRQKSERKRKGFLGLGGMFDHWLRKRQSGGLAWSCVLICNTLPVPQQPEFEHMLNVAHTAAIFSYLQP